MHKSLRNLTWHAVMLFVLFGAATARAAKPSPQLSLAFTGPTVSVSGVTPGADVYLFGVSREGAGYYTTVVERETILHDTAKSGHVDYTLDHPVALRSIWFAVDLSGGTAAAGAPSNYKNARPLDLDTRHLRKNPSGEIFQLSYEGALVNAVVVRPGAGIWGGTIGVHSGKDEGGGDDRHITVSTANLEPRAGTTAGPPAKLKNGDVVFLMDSYLAQYSLGTLGGQP